MNNIHIGEIAGVYTITELMPYKHSDGHAVYKGICNECGFERIGKYNDLKKIKTCKHIGVDGNTIIRNKNWTNKRIGKIFNDMKQRCYNKNDEGYKWYGNKGIKIYEDWLNNPSLFEEWSLKNGYQDNLTIDRIDENKGYYPDNCRWITSIDNSKYKSTTTIINVDGEEHTGRDWAKILGLSINRINIYIKRYGIDNVVEFIRRYKANPYSKLKNNNKNIYNMYMN